MRLNSSIPTGRVADERECRTYSARVSPRVPTRSRSCSRGAARGSPQVASAERQNSAARRQRTQLWRECSWWRSTSAAPRPNVTQVSSAHGSASKCSPYATTIAPINVATRCATTVATISRRNCGAPWLAWKSHFCRKRKRSEERRVGEEGRGQSAPRRGGSEERLGARHDGSLLWY